MTTINLGRVVGEDGEDGRGIVSILKTSTSGLVDTYTITYTDGTTSTFEVTNGQSGGGGTSNYNELTNKPSINDVSLQGNKSLSDLGAQPTLVSGTNIKTINNQSILGSGNINIEGGGGGGISNVAKTMLITILKKCYTSEDMSAEIDVLEDEFSKTGELTSISVSYTGGDVEVGTLTDTLPIVVTASYSDGTSSRVTTGYTLSPTEISEGTNTITVTYSGKTATFTVTGVEITGELTSITAVCNDETATVGTSASELDITVTGHYSDGTSATLSGWTTSGTVQEGTNTFTITYESFTTTITVTGVVGPKVLSSIAVTTDANSAEIGATTGDLKGVIITATYSDSTTETIDISDCTVTPTTIASGTNVLVFSYQNKSATLNLEGIDTTGLTVSSVVPTPTRTTYPTGTNLMYKIEGYYITNYSNGSKVAGDLLETTGIAPVYAEEGTRNYTIGLKGKYPTINNITGVNETVHWLENVTSKDIYTLREKVAELTVTNHNNVYLLSTSNNSDSKDINVSTANIDDRTGINSVIPTYYTIPSGATVVTSVTVNKAFSGLPRIIVRGAKNGGGSLELINIYETGVVGQTKTNTITTDSQITLNGILVYGREGFTTGKELDLDISVTVNGVEIIGGVSNE